MSNDISTELIDMGWKDLIRLADYHETQAATCRARAQAICDYKHMEDRVERLPPELLTTSTRSKLSPSVSLNRLF